MSCTTQGLKTYCPMKTLIENSVTKNDLFNKYSNVALTATQKNKIKGGHGDSIIVEDLIDA